MVEVTQEDREAAASVAVLAEMRELILSGRADHHAEPWAIHRQRGKLEGARLAIEAVLPEVVTDWTIDAHGAHCRCTTCELNIAEDSIRALDPAKIVGEG